MNFVFNQSGEGNTQIGSVDKASLDKAVLDTLVGAKTAASALKPMRRQTMADMSNEQAARVLTKEADGWGDERVLIGTYITALRMGAAALRGPTPDPDTGLVPCGCGGKAETHELFGHYSGTYMTDCKECATGTTQYNTEKESQDAWNTAMGYKGGAE